MHFKDDEYCHVNIPVELFDTKSSKENVRRKVLSHSHTVKNGTNLGPNSTVVIEKQNKSNMRTYLYLSGKYLMKVIKDMRRQEISEGCELGTAKNRTLDIKS